MENKTKEQLLDEYIKDHANQDECIGFIEGYDARQPEIDILKKSLEYLQSCYDHYQV